MVLFYIRECISHPVLTMVGVIAFVVGTLVRPESPEPVLSRQLEQDKAFHLEVTIKSSCSMTNITDLELSRSTYR